MCAIETLTASHSGALWLFIYSWLRTLKEQFSGPVGLELIGVPDNWNTR